MLWVGIFTGNAYWNGSLSTTKYYTLSSRCQSKLTNVPKENRSGTRHTFLQLLIPVNVCPLSLELLKTQTISSLKNKLKGDLQT